MKRPCILCPLKYEAGFVSRALSGLAEVICFGPYESGMCRAFESGVLDNRPLVLVVGVGGGLAETGMCPAITRVVDLDGNEWTPSVLDDGAERVALAGVDVIVPNEPAKRALASETGASIVDMETHVFAKHAGERGLRWGVVRGISDGPSDQFPEWIADILDDHGGVRAGAVARQIVRSPSSIGVLRQIGARGKLAMLAACDRARLILEEEQ